MTDEFKSTLFSYLTGNLKHEEGTHEEIIKEINEIPREKWEGFTPLRNEIENFKYEGLIKVKNSQLFVEYGGFKTKDGDIRGIITILTSDFIPIKTFYQYDSGTYLRYIQCMRQEDDGTFYAVDCPDFPQDENWSSTQTEKRFIMLNNFTQQINEEYVLKLNKSYIMPYKSLYCRKMFKDPNSAHYVLCCSILTGQSNPTYAKTRIIELKINVGSSNEWSYNDTNDSYLMGDSYVEFDSDSKSFVEVILTSNQSTNRNVGVWTKNFNDSSYTYKNVYAFSFQPYIDSFAMENQSVFLNKDEIYFVQNNQHWGISGSKESKYIGLYYYNIKTENRKTIYEKYLGEYDYCNLESIYITQNNNDLYIQYNTNINNEEEKADYYFQRLDSEWKPILIGKDKPFWYVRRSIYAENNYNLLSIILASQFVYNTRDFYIVNIKENYNSSNYNGEPYVNDNALISNSAELYSDSELIFARNLYNKTINDNVTVSTVEIPNTYLNNVNITNKNLLSQTNLHLVKDNNLLQKNIYETVFLNFINAVQVLNKDTETINRQAGVYLNAKINDEKGYDNAKITKVRIRNMEGGETIQSIQIDYPNETVSSTNPQLTNSANDKLNSIKVDGKTVQNGTPTPDDPIEIKNVKGYSNLFNKDGTDIYEAFINGSNKTIVGLANTKTAYVKCKPNTSYYVSKVKSTRFTVGTTTEKPAIGMVCNKITPNNEAEFIKITTGESDNYLVVFYYNGGSDTLSEQEIRESIQIIEGNEEKPYIPFGSNYLRITSSNGTDTNSIFLNLKDNELAENDFVKIANNYGTIYKTKKVLELTGDENWQMNDTVGYKQFYINNNVGAKPGNGLSNCFKYSLTEVAEGNKFYINNSLFVFVHPIYKNNDITTVANFKQFLKDKKSNGTPVVIQYDLLKPYTVDLKMQDSIYSYKGTTNISVDDELTPNIEVNYRLEGNYCILTVGIKVKEPLYQLEFISNDETNVYHTVDLSNLEVGKYYIIKEKLEVL